MNTAFARTEEFDRLTLPSAVRWFKLYEDLAEFGSALAYPCKWDSDNHKWIASAKDEQRETVYSTIAGMTGSATDFLPCWHTGQAWEVLRPGGAKMYRGIIANGASITKGGHGTVHRYTPGTTTYDSTHADDVYNELVTIADGKVVYYMSDGSKLYIIAVECPYT